MKHFRLLLLFILVIAQVTPRLIAGNVEKVYQFSEYTLSRSGGYDLVKFPGALLTGIPGEPALPYLSVSMLLPPGEAAVSITVTGSGETVIPGKFTLYPQQLVRPVSSGSSGTFQINESVYTSAALYPEIPTGKLMTQYLNGYSLALSSFTPVRYNPATGQVTYYTSVTVTITTQPSAVSNAALSNLKTAPEVKKSLLKLVANPEQMDSYSTDQATSTGDYDILIITNNAFLTAFDDLKAHYLAEGLKSQVVSRETINTSMSGIDIQEKIRNYIIQEYQTHSVQHVILGGDDEIIPHRGFFCEVQSSSVYTDIDIPADLYYSALDGNWNTDGDNKWGEPGEDDLLPDISVSRLPFSTLTELQNELHKSLTYRFSPVTGELTNVLLAGEHLYSSPQTWGSDYLELLIGNRTDNGYTTNGIPASYPFDKMYDENTQWSGADLIAHINQGKPLLDHVGHANEMYVMKLTNNDITDANFYNTNGVNHNYTLVYTHGCYCGAYNVNDCIGERMVNIQNFASIFIGNSRYGWFNEGQTEGPSAHLNREFIDALYNDSLVRIGHAHRESKIATAPWVTAPGQWEPGALRWCFYCCNVLGDGVMSFYTAEPYSISVNYPATVAVGSSSMNVSVTSSGNPAPGLSCVVISGGAMIGKAVTNASGIAVITFDSIIQAPVDATLTVSGINCTPISYNITFVAASGPYVTYAGSTINDPAGNQNGLADFGETIGLTTGLRNMGQTDAFNVQAVLTTSDPYVAITDDTDIYPAIAAGATVYNPDAFTFTVSDSVPDLHAAAFQLTANYAGSSTPSTFYITLNAPRLEAYALHIDDASGNGNGRPDPGETIYISIPCSNQGHAEAGNCSAQITSSSSYLTIVNTAVNLGNLGIGQIVNTVFEAVVSPETPPGEVLEINLELSSGYYHTSKSYFPVASIIVEDFESGGFATFAWNQLVAIPWVITSSNPYEGSYCAKSGVIGNSQSSILSIRMHILQDDSISFYRKISSEEIFDLLKFSIDKEVKQQWSGIDGWKRFSYPITTGVHSFAWEYTKDAFTSSGDDCAWVDFIVFPAFDYLTVSTGSIDKPVSFFLCPNPAKDVLHITFSPDHEKPLSYRIVGTAGNTVKEGIFPANADFASGWELRIAGLKPGSYFLQLLFNNSAESRLFIVK